MADKTIYHNIGHTENTTWWNTIGSQIFDSIIKELESYQGNKLKIEDYKNKVNNFQRRHFTLYKNAKNTWSHETQYTDKTVKPYLDEFHREFNTINPNIIGKANSRYEFATNGNGTDNNKKNWEGDGIYGGQTDDRRLLFREDDGDDVANNITSLNNKLKKFGLKINLNSDTKYYELANIDDPDKKPEETKEDDLKSEDGIPGEAPSVGWGVKLAQNFSNIDPEKILMELIPLTNYFQTNLKNRKNRDIALHGLTATLNQPILLNRQIVGDLATKNYLENQAARIRFNAAQSTSSNALFDSMTQLAAEQAANDLELKGYLADNEKIQKTKEELVAINDKNTVERAKVANENLVALNSMNKARTDILTSYNTNKYNNKITKLEEFYANLSGKRNKQMALDESYFSSMLSDISLDSEVIQAKEALKNNTDPQMKDELEENYKRAIENASKRQSQKYYEFKAKQYGIKLPNFSNHSSYEIAYDNNNIPYLKDYKYVGMKKGGKFVKKYGLGDVLGNAKDFFQTSFNKDNWRGSVSTITDVGMKGLGFDHHSEYEGKEGETAMEMKQALDTAAMVFPAAAPFIKAGQLATGIIDKLGGGTDGMTKTDAILSQIPVLQAINGFGGQKSHELNNITNQVNTLYGDKAMSGFSGTLNDVNGTMMYSNKKYGLFSSSARKKANRAIDKLNQQQSQIADIAASARNVFDVQSGMSDINANATAFDLNGGYQQGKVHVGKEGMKFEYDFRLPFEYDFEIEKFKKGGKQQRINSEEKLKRTSHSTSIGTSEFDKINQTPNQNRSSNKKLKNYNENISYVGGGGEYLNEFEENQNSSDLSDENLYYDESTLQYYRNIGSYKLSNGKYSPLYCLTDRNEIWGNEIREITDDGNIEEDEYLYDIDYNDRPSYFIYDKNQGWISVQPSKDNSKLFKDYTNLFKKGGQMNVIPEGNLHARLHHMEGVDGLTKKGIPVIDNDGNQLAEIELNEIIFNKETTEKLEKLWKEGTDEAAIEAGKILAKEIIENTDDRTGLIKTIK